MAMRNFFNVIKGLKVKDLPSRLKPMFSLDYATKTISKGMDNYYRKYILTRSIYPLPEVRRQPHAKEHGGLEQDLESEEYLWELYEKWKNDHNVDQKRFNTFKEKVIFIDDFNKNGGSSCTLGLNQFSDMTAQEVTSLCTGYGLNPGGTLFGSRLVTDVKGYNAIYEDLMNRVKASSIEQLAWEKVDGVVRQFEAGAENYAQSTIPTARKHKISAHEGGCGSILFENNSGKLISGGQDRTIKMWNTNTRILSRTLHGCLGSVLDLTVTRDNSSIIAASSSNNLYVWEAGSGRIRHTLTGHKDKVCSVDANIVSNRHLVSAAYDRTIKVWDLQRGYCTNTMISHSNCNTVCFSNDGQTICSGHIDGNLRLWDSQSGKLLSEVAAHSNAITSICLSQNGNIVLTSGRDNLHNLFDMRYLEVCGNLRANGNRLASNWSRSCISADDNYVAAGSADGFVYIWSTSKREVVSTLKEHTAPVLSCSWSGLGKPVASADKGGTICIWA